MLGSPLQLRCTYTDRRFRDSDPATLCQTPASLHDLLSPAMEADLHQWPLLAPHSAKPQLLFMTPSCLQNQYQWETLTHYQVSLQARGTTLAHTNYSFYLLTLRKHFSEDFSSVINHSQFLSPRWPALIVPAKRRFHFSHSGLLFIRANASALANQNHELLIQNKTLTVFTSLWNYTGLHHLRCSQHSYLPSSHITTGH